MRFSIIACIYNAAPLVRQCLEALLARTTEDPDTWELVLVDNESPDPNTTSYIYPFMHENARPLNLHSFSASSEKSKKPRIVIVGQHKNLGCHEGWNFGYAMSTGEYVVKLDDDTIIQTDGWLTKMGEALEKIPNLAYISADIDAKQANRYELQDHGGINIEVPLNQGAVVGFSCVMFRRKDIERWGPMKSKYRAAGGKAVDAERLYGGEEAYYALQAQIEGRMIAHFPAVFCHHLTNEERHPDYAAWKRAYGFHAWTDKEMKDWVASGDHVETYARFIVLELRNCPRHNDALLLEWVTRLGQLGNHPAQVNIVEAVMKVTENNSVLNACTAAVQSIKERIQ